MTSTATWHGHAEEARIRDKFSLQLGKMLQSEMRTASDRRVLFVSVSAVRWGRFDSTQIREMWASEREISEFSLVQGDTLICEGGEGGRAAVVPRLGDKVVIFQNHVIRARSKSGNQTSNDFLRYALEAASSLGWLGAVLNGATIKSMSKSQLGRLTIPWPCETEQELIVRYLDHAELRIAKAIAAKTELATLLQQQRLALLCSEVLGRDLEADPDRNYQNLSESRVLDWVGPVPNNWDVVPVNGVFDAVKRKNVGLIENQVLSLSYGRVIIKPREKLRGLVPESFETYQVVEPGDVIVRPTDLQNDTTSLRVGQVQDRGIITSAYIAIRPKVSVNPAFVMMQLAAYDFLKVLYGFGSGLRQNLDFKHLKHVPMMLPSSSEQSMIVERVRSKTEYVESAQQSVAREIALLKEYRTRLISDVVAGKLDVREEAAKLPVIDPDELVEATAGAGLTAEDDGDDE